MIARKPHSPNLMFARKHTRTFLCAGTFVLAGTLLLAPLPGVGTVAAVGFQDQPTDSRVIRKAQKFADQAEEKVDKAASKYEGVDDSLGDAEAAVARLMARKDIVETDKVNTLYEKVIEAYQEADQASQDAAAALANAEACAQAAQDLLDRATAGEDIDPKDIRDKKREAARAAREAKQLSNKAQSLAQKAEKLAAKHAKFVVKHAEREGVDIDVSVDANGHKIITAGDPRVLVAGQDNQEDQQGGNDDSGGDGGSQLQDNMDRDALITEIGFDPMVPNAGGRWANYYDERSGNLDDMGWTILPVAPDARLIYVSSSEGSDSNDGLDPSRPLKTIAKGKTLLRDGYPDRLLMKRGDVFFEAIGKLNYGWNQPISGRSSDEPMVIGAYGTGPRPILKIGAETGLEIRADENTGSSFLAIVGLHFYAHTRDPESSEFVGIDGGQGLRSISTGEYLLIEDCRFDYCGIGVDPLSRHDQDARFKTLKIRRSIVFGNYSRGGHSQGIFVDSTDGLLLEENLFDHNGWNDLVGAERTKFNHNAYIQSTCRDLIARGNIFSRGSSAGLMARPGGIIEYNLFVGNSIQLNYARVWGADATPGGVSGSVRRNTFLDAVPDADSGETKAIIIGNIKEARIEENVADRSGAVRVDATHENGAIGIRNLRFAKNKISTDRFAVMVYETDFQNTSIGSNLLGGAERTFEDKDGGLHFIEVSQNMEKVMPLLHSIGNYYAMFGGGTSLDDYLDDARQIGRQNWRWMFVGGFASDWLLRHVES